MKNLKLYLCLMMGIFAASCSDDFLQRPPLDQVTDLDYFKSPNDLKTYVNQFYTSSMFVRYGNYGNDFDSDNEIDPTPDSRLQGTRTVSTSGSISFANVRSINYFFDHYQKVKEGHELADYKQYLGEAYFFKGLIYFNLLKTYGGIQWLDTELGTSSPELYNPRDPRNVVADNIIKALDSAALYLTEEKTTGAGRVNKWMALLIQSRVALYEGSWEKYHKGTPFGVPDAQPDKYFQKAVDACQLIMDSKLYDIYSTQHPAEDYKGLFSLRTYASNPEVMFWRQYDNDLSRGDGSFTNVLNSTMEHPNGHTITKQLADAYLCTDGKPISKSALFGGYKDLKDEMQHRDPRFRQTIATPDEVWKIFSDGSKSYWSEVYQKLNTTADYDAPSGYVVLKGYNPIMEYHVKQYEETPSILYRYAEVLLNYAEAKLELGKLAQTDLDLTINKLRDRVGMPHLVIGSIVPDPNWNFPALSPLVNEVRRERRVELALEGFRWDDIARWAAADELIVGQRPKGFKASQLNLNTYPVDESGFLDPYKNAMPDGYGFVLGRDYLNSIPESEIVLNPKLEQNPGW